MALFDFLVMAVIVWGIVRSIARWLRTPEWITHRQIKGLEQRLPLLETQEVGLVCSLSVLDHYWFVIHSPYQIPV